MKKPQPLKLDLYRTAIPMRNFEHAAASRAMSEAILVRLQYDDGFVGWGETLPRNYVTGETLQTVPEDIEQVIWPKCLQKNLLVASEKPREIPSRSGRRCLNAAACAVDLASLRRLFHDLHHISPLALQRTAGRPRIRNYIDAKASGVLGSSDPSVTAKQFRKMRWFGLMDFKLKLGFEPEADRANLRLLHRKLRRGIRKGLCSLRVDINGAWDEATTPERVEELVQYGVCVVEQPVFCSARKFVSLARKCSIPLMADESLLTERHAKILLEEPEKVWWNLRISKNGGLIPTLRLMQMAAANDIPFTMGSMVGETSILSAAQRRALQLGTFPRFTEGNYGRWLLSDDILAGRKTLRFGYSGSLKALRGDGLGIVVDERKVRKYGTHLGTLGA